ncbi:MAG: hypothetical protein H0X04_05890, partial [Chthoniobacterales bacterium]|nr:hypothetical protein [Chthoniobacterales bacterium]
MSEEPEGGGPQEGGSAPHWKTLEQQPDAITAGAPTTPPAEDADRDQENPTPGARTPLEAESASLKKPRYVAAGLPAIYQTTRFAMREMGLARSAKTLLKVNQKNGFDCQSCAWPSPDHERQVAEFCENGAKAIADEGTTKRVTAKFFRE